MRNLVSFSSCPSLWWCEIYQCILFRRNCWSPTSTSYPREPLLLPRYDCFPCSSAALVTSAHYQDLANCSAVECSEQMESLQVWNRSSRLFFTIDWRHCCPGSLAFLIVASPKCPDPSVRRHPRKAVQRGAIATPCALICSRGLRYILRCAGVSSLRHWTVGGSHPFGGFRFFSTWVKMHSVL